MTLVAEENNYRFEWILKQRHQPYPAFLRLLCKYAPTQIRTGVLALKGLRPGPLDDGGGSQATGFYHP